MQFAIADLFECVADAVPDRTAVVSGTDRITYRELDRRSTRLAHALARLGARPGDHVGLHLYSVPAHVEAMLACFKLRAVPINVNYRYVDAELAQLFDDADLVGVFHHADMPPPAGTDLRFAVAVDGDDYESLIDASSPDRDFGARSGDDHYVLYTGGTTGLPKGVVWRQEDILFLVTGGGNPGGEPLARPEDIAHAVVENRAQRAAPFLGPTDAPPERYAALSLGPLMHASGQWMALGTLIGGGTLVLYPDRHLDMAAVLRLVERERVTMLSLVGDANARPLLEELTARPGDYDTSSLLVLGSGGSILSGDVKERLMAALPSALGILEGLGSSESPVTAAAVTRRDGQHQESLRFTARPTTAVFDDDWRPVAPGSSEVGRLATSGRVPLAYYKDPERSARTFIEMDGTRWSITGDMATVDADGAIRLVGRGSLCINTGGEKVYPEEVEAAIKSHAAVDDAVVVGVPDEQWGQRVAAVVALVDGAGDLSLEALQAHCRSRLAAYKVPRSVTIVDAVRRSPAGKADYVWASAVGVAAAD